jgi:hypothetical protein
MVLRCEALRVVVAAPRPSGAHRGRAPAPRWLECRVGGFTRLVRCGNSKKNFGYGSPVPTRVCALLGSREVVPDLRARRLSLGVRLSCSTLPRSRAMARAKRTAGVMRSMAVSRLALTGVVCVVGGLVAGGLAWFALTWRGAEAGAGRFPKTTPGATNAESRSGSSIGEKPTNAVATCGPRRGDNSRGRALGGAGGSGWGRLGCCRHERREPQPRHETPRRPLGTLSEVEVALPDSEWRRPLRTCGAIEVVPRAYRVQMRRCLPRGACS